MSMILARIFDCFYLFIFIFAKLTEVFSLPSTCSCFIFGLQKVTVTTPEGDFGFEITKSTTGQELLDQVDNNANEE